MSMNGRVKIDPSESYMFLARNNCYLPQIEDFVRSKGMMYRYKGRPSANKEDVAAINMYEKVRKNRIMSDSEGYKLLPFLKKPLNLNNPWYDAFIWKEEKCNYIRDLVRNKVSLSDIKIDIGTIHSVKGGECDNVVMLLDITKSVQTNLDVNPDTEHRVFYVGATRARKSLSIVKSTSKFEYTIY